MADRSESPVLSRHRLRQPYRTALAALWCVPPLLLALAILIGNGFTPSFFDPRFLLPAILMALPARYIWQEGVDVLPDGIVARVYWPRYYAYERLEMWYFDGRREKQIITVWDDRLVKVLECRAGHLTDVPALLRALRKHVRDCRWPG